MESGSISLPSELIPSGPKRSNSLPSHTQGSLLTFPDQNPTCAPTIFLRLSYFAVRLVRCLERACRLSSNAFKRSSTCPGDSLSPRVELFGWDSRHSCLSLLNFPKIASLNARGWLGRELHFPCVCIACPM